MRMAMILAAWSAAIATAMPALGADAPDAAAPAAGSPAAGSPAAGSPAAGSPAAGTPAPENAEAYIIWPRNGAVIAGGKFWLRMGLRNMGVAPKGVKIPNTGHHHLLVDAELPPAGEQIPSDRNHLHFGAGETEARIELPPGKHTLQLLLGDHDHRVHNPPVYSRKITITVR